MIQKSISLALDIFPYNSDLHSVCDYGGQQIFAKVALPLVSFRKGAFCLLAARSLRFSQDGLCIEMMLKEKIFWSDGTPINAKDYVLAFMKIMMDVSNRYRNLLSDIVGYPDLIEGDPSRVGVSAVNDNTIRFKLRNKNRWFVFILAQLNFSPWHEDRNVSAGPYYIQSNDQVCYVLRRNEFYQVEARSPVECLKLVSYEKAARQVDCIADYFKGDIDVTCNTVLEYGQYEEFSKRSDVFMSWSGLALFLVPGKLFCELPDEFKRSLAFLFDREAIANSLFNVPQPIYDYSSLYGVPRLHLSLSDARFDGLVLSIIYDGFYPNLEVANEIKLQLEQRGAIVTLKEVRFGDWSVESQLRLIVHAAAKFGPLAFYKADLLSGYVDGAAFENMRRLYSIYLQTHDQHLRAKTSLALERAILLQGISVPLVMLPTAALIRPPLCRFSIYDVGVPIQIR